MSRGPRSPRTLADAIQVAGRRGVVHVVQKARESLYDIVISAAVPAAFVRVKYAERILLALPEVEFLYRDAIAGLRTLASPDTISRELWLHSRHGTWRFFRVLEPGLAEISADGRLLTAAG